MSKEMIKLAKDWLGNIKKIANEQTDTSVMEHMKERIEVQDWLVKQAERVQELESFKDSAEYTVDTETMELIIANQNDENSMNLKEINYEKIYELQQTIFFLKLKLSDFKEYANKIKKMSDEKMIKDYADRFMGDISETLQALEDEE